MILSWRVISMIRTALSITRRGVKYWPSPALRFARRNTWKAEDTASAPMSMSLSELPADPLGGLGLRGGELEADRLVGAVGAVGVRVELEQQQVADLVELLVGPRGLRVVGDDGVQQPLEDALELLLGRDLQAVVGQRLGRRLGEVVLGPRQRRVREGLDVAVGQLVDGDAGGAVGRRADAIARSRRRVSRSPAAPRRRGCRARPGRCGVLLDESVRRRCCR